MHTINQPQQDKLIAWLKAKIEEAEQKGESMFMGAPDAWFAHGLHCCNNGHVNSMYLKSEALRGNVCLTCHQPSHLFPTDTTEQELREALGIKK